MKDNILFKLFALLVIASFALSACGPSSSTADITFIIGDGTEDQRIHQIVYPNQTVPSDMTYLTTRVAPGNYRNYVIDDGTRRNPKNPDGSDGGPVSDSQKLLGTVIPSGTRIQVGLTALWMLNQTAYVDANGFYSGPLADFYKFEIKYKYNLMPTNDSTNVVNNSTTGWNSMLAENFYPALSHALDQAMYNIANDFNSLDPSTPIVFPLKIDDGIYKADGKPQRDVLAAEISRLFDSEIKKMTGVGGEPMFCGSGTQSGWTNQDPNQAGKPGNEFKCAPVRIQIDSVIINPDQGGTNSQSLVDTNRSEYEAAYERYHEQTDCWMGILDAIEACGKFGVACTVILDGSTCKDANGNPASDALYFGLPDSQGNPTLEPVTIEVTPAP
jgi:hypothetical protein